MHHSLLIIANVIAGLIGLLFAFVIIAARLDKVRGKRENTWYSYIPEVAMENYHSQSVDTIQCNRVDTHGARAQDSSRAA